MDFALARSNMVKSQVLPNRVLEEQLLKSLGEVPRERFVDTEFRDFAYSDYPIPFAAGNRRMLTPLQIAWMIQALEVKAGDRVLVIGAGLGYEVALLVQMGVHVYAMERDPELAARGEQAGEGATVHWRVGDLALGWPEESPFDGVLLCGAVNAIPNRPIGQLGKHGRLVGIVGKSGSAVMQAIRMVGISGGDRPEVLFETTASDLPGLGLGERFEL